MKGIVEKLCELESIEIPEDMLKVTIDEHCTDKGVEQLAIRYADESYVNTVEKGDLAYCTADKESRSDERKILVYTGVILPGAEKAAEDVIGKSIGDEVKTVICEKEVTLTIEKILRRIPVEVDDSIVKKENIEGVNTVEEYKKYLYDKTLADTRLEKSKVINYFIIKMMERESTFVYDQEELDKTIGKYLEEYKAYEEFKNEDPKDVYELTASQIKQGWVVRAFCESRGLNVDVKEAEEEADRMIEMLTLMGEEVPSREELIEDSLMNEYYGKFFAYLEDYVTKKMEEQ